jgi:hypothetical protein
MMYHHTLLHDSLVTTIKPKVKHRFHAAAMFFYIKKLPSQEIHTFKDPLPHNISGTSIAPILVPPH